MSGTSQGSINYVKHRVLVCRALVKAVLTIHSVLVCRALVKAVLTM